MPEIVITVNANMDSKEGIEKVVPVDAQAAELLDPSFLRPGTHDAATADPPRERAGSPTGSCVLLDEHPRWESNCLYVRVLRDSDAILEQDRKVPEYCWNVGISKDICEARTGVVPDTFSVDLLSDTEFLVYHVPKTTRGMSDCKARSYADLIMGSYLWAGSPATIFVTKRTTQEARRDKVKTKEYRQKITVQRLATAQARLKDLEMVTQKRQERAANPVVRGRGMIHRADKYLAQRHGKEPERIPGTVPVLPTFLDRAATPDDYHSAREPSESEYDSEETDPEENRDDVDDDVCVGSDTTFKSSGHDMDRTNRMTTANQTQRHNQQKRKESRGQHPTNARKDCFYAGLKEHNKYLVSHMKDREQYGPAQMLREIREQEDSCYPANTSPKPHHTDSGNKNTSHYNKNSMYDKPRVYTVRHTDVQIPDQGGDEPDLSPTNEIDPDEIYDEGYYVAVINTANEADKWGRCFNCGPSMG